uniref:PIH1 N-terminal domain-containing protein n=1 Tax=Chelydra serpentina TaxID=8475 RepID=A0A8C3S4F7_CHESE
PFSLQATQKIQSAMPSVRDAKPIQPQPGFCIKTHAGAQEKVFVNVCRSLHVPPPPDLSREELECLIESDSASSFRVPMSLGEPHAELDNSGNGCTAYDVVINSGFFSKVEVSAPCWAGPSRPHNPPPEWRILKNRKFMGSISGQTIRTKSSPGLAGLVEMVPWLVDWLCMLEGDRVHAGGAAKAPPPPLAEIDRKPQARACPLWVSCSEGRETSERPMELCCPQADSGGWVHGQALGQRE